MITNICSCLEIIKSLTVAYSATACTYSINIGDLKNRAVLLLGMQQNQNCIGNGLKSSIF